MTLIGVAGSSGKTTTSWLVRGIFEELEQVTGMIGALRLHSVPCSRYLCSRWNPVLRK